MLFLFEQIHNHNWGSVPNKEATGGGVVHYKKLGAIVRTETFFDKAIFLNRDSDNCKRCTRKLQDATGTHGKKLTFFLRR